MSAEAGDLHGPEAEEARRRLARWPEFFGRWLALAGATLAWAAAICLALTGHEWIAVVFAVTGALALGAALFYSRIRMITRDGIYLDPELAEEVAEKVERTVLTPELRSQVRASALRDLARDTELQTSPDAADEAVRRVMRRRHTAEAERETQRAATAVGEYLEAQGYRVAQELTGDDYRVDLVGSKDGERVVAELQLNLGWVREERAGEIIDKLAAILAKFDTRDGIVVVTAGAFVDADARALLEQAGLRLLRIDAESGEVRPS
jgi:HJR/Mrr/RecB family endonuclease